MVELRCEGRCGVVARLDTQVPDFQARAAKVWREHIRAHHGPGYDPVFVVSLLTLAGATVLGVLLVLAHA